MIYLPKLSSSPFPSKSGDHTDAQLDPIIFVDLGIYMSSKGSEGLLLTSKLISIVVYICSYKVLSCTILIVSMATVERQ